MAFESIDVARERLEKNMAINRYRQIVVSAQALFSRDTSMVLGKPLAHSRLKPDASHPSEEDIEVMCRRFDELKEGFGLVHVDVVKMDIEGG